MTHVILDGTLIASDCLAGVRDNGNDLWFSQKHKAFGGNVQFLSAPRTQTPHSQPEPDRRHRPRRTRPQCNLEVICTEKTSVTTRLGR